MNTLPILFKSPNQDGGGLGDLANPLSLGLGALQTGIGIIGGIGAKKRQRKLLAQRKSYQTPQEIFDILNATESNASQGYDPTTLSYLTNQTDQAFSSSLSDSLRLGADPNNLSAAFGQKVNAIMKIGADSHAENMANFSAYLNALGTGADNKAAEQKSKEDILKDKLQAEGVNLQNSSANISGGLNTILSSLSADQISNLYNTDGTLKTKKVTSTASNFIPSSSYGI